jgi:hypothetical protein
MTNEIERYAEPGLSNVVAVPEGTGVLDTVPWLVDEYDKAQRAKAYWDKRLEELKGAIEQVAGPLESITLNGDEVFTYARINSFRGAEFKKAHPDLAKVYERVREVTELDIDLLRVGQPDKFAEFQSRALRRKV